MRPAASRESSSRGMRVSLVVDKHGINRLEQCPEGDFLDLLPQR